MGTPLTEPGYYGQYRKKAVDAINACVQGFNCDVWINPPTSEKGQKGIVEATNMLVNKCLRDGYDYLWIVEGDVEVPSDALQRLFLPAADINVGMYPNHREDMAMMAGYFRHKPDGNPPEIVRIHQKSFWKGRVFTGMVCAGIGCALIGRRVFESGLRFVYDVELFRRKVGGHDQLFLYQAQRRDFRVFLHGDVICGHLPEWPLDKVSEFDDNE